MTALGSGSATGRSPSLVASIGGFLRPGHDTFREAGAGAVLIGAAAAAGTATVVYAVFRRRWS